MDVRVAYRIVTKDVYVVSCVNHLTTLALCSNKHMSERVFPMVAVAHSG